MTDALSAGSRNRSRKHREPKSRTGCLTCKIRHLKCDEKKPFCQRCHSTGRSCDGYDFSVTIPASSPRLSLSLALAADHARSEIDSRGFDYFRRNATLGLMGFDYQSEFWSQTVLQFSETSPAVFRAALALSVRHEQLYQEKQRPKDSEDELRFLRQYNKSIRQLCRPQSNQPIHFTLTCCILFICLENLAGNYDIALSHLGNGLKMLKEWHSTATISGSERQARNQITMVFCRLDMQATAFLDSRPPELDISFVDESSDTYSLVPATFLSLPEAQVGLEKLMIRLLYTLTLNNCPEYPFWPEHNMHLPTRLKVLEGLRAGCADWKKAFDALSIQRSRDWQTKDLQLSVLLALHHQTTSTMLELRLRTSREKSNPNSSNDLNFKLIIELARSLINSASKDNISFAADMGVISVVYFVAMNGLDFEVRRQAIDLLGQIQGREGFWDPKTAAIIAEKTFDLEVSGNMPVGTMKGGIPELTKAFETLHLNSEAASRA